MSLSLPLTLEDITLWLAFNALILLVTCEVLSSHYRKINIHINHKRLEKATLAVAILFLISIVISALNLIRVR